MTRILIAVSIFLSTVNAFAMNEIMYIGGGGERGNAVNNFDTSINFVQNLSARRKAKIALVLDIEHPSTKKIVSERPYLSVEMLTKASVEKTLVDLTDRIARSEIKPGESLLVFVESHGTQSETGNVLIETTDGALDIETRLKTLVEMAALKKVKLGLIMGNCYSGTLLKLDPENKACLVSVSAPGRLGYTNFAPQIVKNLSTGQDLESAFLEARKSFLIEEKYRELFGLPQISTEAGVTTMQQMSVLSRFRFNPIDKYRVLGDRIAREEDLAQIDQLKRLAASSLSQSSYDVIEKSLTRFRRSAKQFGLSKEEIEKRNASAKYLNVDQNEWCVRHLAASTEELKMWKFSTQSEYCAGLAIVPRCADVDPKKRPGECSWDKVKAFMADRIFRERARFLERTVADVNQELLTNVLPDRVAESVFTNAEERILYDGIYRSHAAVLKKTANACREFNF